ncbi:PQQ-binding-like beta-propeller repeat protein [Kitasatospora sp. NPDC059817]|uniref:caspase, EACC1-associated type n=1 Tax=Kitasatospora sp. NPDC059817 TaxID=3346961 RepID=UPI003661184E
MIDRFFGDRNRGALLIGTGTYDHPLLPSLRSPEVDCAALTEVLRDPNAGGFDVQQLVDADRPTLERAIEEFFASALRDDVRLLYISGHGIVNRHDKLYFAVQSTEPDRPAHSAISAAFVHDLMDECRARSIIVVLDCCYSGLFISGAKGDGPMGFEDVLAGHGRVVLTAGTGLQRAWEGDHLDEETPVPSRFTRVLVEGLVSGNADLNGDGLITVQELYRYVCEQLHREGSPQDPRMAGEMQYDIPLAQVRRKRRPQKPRTTRTEGRRRPPVVHVPRQFETVWKAPVASGTARQPIASADVLIVQDHRRLHVINAKSHQRYPLIEMNHAGRPGFHGASAFFPDRSGWLQIADLQTGKRRRYLPVPVCDGLLSVSANTLYAPGPDGVLRAIDLDRGSERWSFPVPGLAITSAPQTAAGTLAFMATTPSLVNGTTSDGKWLIAAIDATTGVPSWSHKAEHPLLPEWAVTDQGIYSVQQANATQSRIVALDPSNGEVLWAFDTSAKLAAAPLAASGSVIFGDLSQRLVALDAKTGIPQWEKKTAGRLLAQPFVSNSTVFTADRSGSLTSRQLTKGRAVRTHDLLLSSDTQGSPAIVEGLICATDARGDVHALAVGTH